jgi:UDP-glucuronate decarboxylase
VHPQKKEYWGNINPIGREELLRRGQKSGRDLCFDYLRQNKGEIKVIRIFSTYGPRMRPEDGRVVSSFIVEAIQGRDITAYGSGDQTRSFCYIEDMIEGMIRMMDYETGTGENPKGANYTRPSLSGFPDPINLGNHEEVSIGALAEKIIRLARSDSKIIFEELPEDDPRRRYPGIPKARHYLEWEPKVPREEGLKRTIEYVKSS